MASLARTATATLLMAQGLKMRKMGHLWQVPQGAGSVGAHSMRETGAHPQRHPTQTPQRFQLSAVQNLQTGQTSVRMPDSMLLSRHWQQTLAAIAFPKVPALSAHSLRCMCQLETVCIAISCLHRYMNTVIFQYSDLKSHLSACTASTVLALHQQSDELNVWRLTVACERPYGRQQLQQ